ncbi:MAG: ROK family protein [Verrucomicrobiota bacterium]
MALESSGARPDLLRRLNRERVVDVIRHEGAMTRAALGRAAGVSYPTVLKVVAELMEEGLLEEGGIVQPSMGRPGKAVAMASSGSRVASVVLGVEECTVAEARLDGTLVPGMEFKFAPPASYEALLEKISEALDFFSSDRNPHRLLGIGVALPGVIDRDEGRVIVSPNLPWLNDKALASDIETRFGLPTTLVRAMHAHYLAAADYGDGRGVEDFIVINFAGGIGMGACAGGRFIDGGGGMSGELGHLSIVPEGGKRCGCGHRGCLETVASDRAVVDAANERTGRMMSIEEIIESVRAGDLEIDDVLERAADTLGAGVATAINVLNPSRVLLFGHFMAARDDLFDRFVAEARNRALSPVAAKVEFLPPSRESHHAQQIGAAAAVIEVLVAGKAPKDLAVAV